MEEDGSTAFDEDLESAYRKALLAVEAADLAPSREIDDEDGTGDGPDVLPFALSRSSPAQPLSHRDSESSDQATVPRGTLGNEDSNRVTPRQVLEAAVFVGGIELSAAKLAGLLKGDFTREFVTRSLDELNRKYAAENRAYEIRCDEHLFRLALKDEFEPLRRRVYGLGPKEVKLGQDSLEILSLIAYRQPITRAEIESLREGNIGNILRQLVRRQLIAVRRDADATDAAYVTTDRFLEVFGIANLDELPRAEQLQFK